MPSASKLWRIFVCGGLRDLSHGHREYAHRAGKVKGETDAQTRARLKEQISECDGHIASFAKLIADSVLDGDVGMLEIYKTQIKTATDKKKELESALDDVPESVIATDKFRTALTRQIFNKNTAQTDGELSLAAPTGFEPVFSP